MKFSLYSGAAHLRNHWTELLWPYMAWPLSQTSNLADALRGQRQNELRHLTQLALSIAQEEHATVAGKENFRRNCSSATQRPGSARYASETETISG